MQVDPQVALQPQLRHRQLRARLPPQRRVLHVAVEDPWGGVGGGWGRGGHPPTGGGPTGGADTGWSPQGVSGGGLLGGLWDIAGGSEVLQGSYGGGGWGMPVGSWGSLRGVYGALGGCWWASGGSEVMGDSWGFSRDFGWGVSLQILGGVSDGLSGVGGLWWGSLGVSGGSGVLGSCGVSEGLLRVPGAPQGGVPGGLGAS